MARRNESILNLLIQVPWWVSVVVSGAAYLFLKFIFPSIDFGREETRGLAIKHSQNHKGARSCIRELANYLVIELLGPLGY